jgi:TonB family protein
MDLMKNHRPPRQIDYFSVDPIYTRNMGEANDFFSVIPLQPLNGQKLFQMIPGEMIKPSVYFLHKFVGADADAFAGFQIGDEETLSPSNAQSIPKKEQALTKAASANKSTARETPPPKKPAIEANESNFKPLLELGEGSIYLNSRKIGLDNLASNLENLEFATKPKRLYIKANQYLSYGYFLNAYDFIAHTDIKELVFINDKGVNDIINILDPKINPEAFTIEIPENILNQIILSIYLNDKVLINREQIISKDLFGLLKALYKERKDKYICVRADLRLPFKEVLAYFPNIKKAGIETIFIYAELFTDDDIPRMKIAEQITSYEKLIFRDMFVSLNLIGSIGEDIQKGDISITPWKIRVKGPLEKVDGHYTATTSLIDAVQLTKEKEVKADILLPSPSLEIESQQKKVLVKIEMDKIKARNLKNVAGEDLKPMRAIGDIKQPKLIRRIDPIYPDIARKNKVAGIVVLEVTTDINGKVQEARVLRSIPLLDQAAIDTVKKWEYEPYIFEGKPRGLIFTVTVTFTY